MRRPALRVVLTIVLLILAALMCWLAQPALAPPAADATPDVPDPTDEPPVATDDTSALTLTTYKIFPLAAWRLKSFFTEQSR